MGKRAPVKIVVLDVLKPHEPNILDLGRALCQDSNVLDVNVSVYAVDEKTESTKVTISGKDIDFDQIKKIVDDNGAVIHSIDKVVVGKKEIIPVPPEVSLK
ncbi:DUF211 domain-containing protein [Candidatus Woesearchaeota archaeon]|nr:DUF211 domain-containing protein [Candidatus Woesearchaeota archaeon]